MRNSHPTILGIGPRVRQGQRTRNRHDIRTTLPGQVVSQRIRGATRTRPGRALIINSSHEFARRLHARTPAKMKTSPKLLTLGDRLTTAAAVLAHHDIKRAPVRDETGELAIGLSKAGF
ncbi:hypothetical protein [Nocardia vaccinii]|uniref:hypothetical protein n=1 Tax=Nocardia vaccinii TaxID=1822 RepID=UPI0008316D1E|nr:hypothetical protein [Nocardia vaccinii]